MLRLTPKPTRRLTLKRRRSPDRGAPSHRARSHPWGRARRLRLDLGYDGTGFAGWARQREQRTVEATVDEALQRVMRLDASPRLTVAGRTDAGVHARGQVAHTDVPELAWAEHHSELIKRLRGVLPGDVRVTAVRLAPEHFDARFAAIQRRYAYRICDLPGGVDPLRRHDVLQNLRPLDVSAMNQAAQGLTGERDFASFCKKREGASTIRRLIEFRWSRTSEDGGGHEMVVGHVVADAFCHNMVRSLVGASLSVGEGRRSVDWPAEILQQAERSSSVPVVAPHGLTLEEVVYPPDDQLLARTQQTRRRRGP